MSPYITECPYCGARLRKRAPKLTGAERKDPRSKLPLPKLSPMMPGEIPGIRSDPLRRPWLTGMIVVLSLLGAVFFLYRWFFDARFLLGEADEYYRALWAPFVYVNEWYALVVIAPIAIFGGLLERRYGSLVVLIVFALCGMGTYGLTALLEPGVIYLGAPGAALGLLAAWAMPFVLRERHGIEHDADLTAVAVIGIAVSLMPAVVDPASVVQAVAGLVIGILIGLLLSRTAAAR